MARAASHIARSSTPIADRTQSVFGRKDLILGVNPAGIVVMSVADPYGVEWVRAVRTLKPGDLEASGTIDLIASLREG
jgi:hypothetical protein